ncbi:FHA domain-containing protein [Amycolatopsis sp. A133]|uniref:FHA domain-containing protein n=1 Tax=Amycolatopsis sp. A133 TaxID=3064472 RepID=UPI0027ECFDDE|nr:FHA domain-containing protein [Amycolatopsis sp. A133]MDQ7808746.1 FHA domain-containing protein [Amycolatopsis sp. A133]
MTTTSLRDEPLKFRPGRGILVRHPGLAVLTGPCDDETTSGVLRTAADSAADDRPGQAFGRAILRLLAGGTELPALCAFGALDEGVSVLVHGAARMTVRTPSADQVLDGQDAVTLVDRVLPAVTSLRAAFGDESTEPGRWCELGSGTVPAEAIWWGAAGSPPEPAGTEPPEEAPAAPAPTIAGVRCRSGHFNDPDIRYCSSCGLGLTQAGRTPARSERPAVGVLVLDDGSAFPLTGDHLIGRMPHETDEVRAGTATAVRLQDPAVSGVHARITLDDWNVAVTDAGSVNGTFLRDPGTGAWTKLARDTRAVLRPGMVVAVGGRQLRYDSYRKP